MTRQSLQMKSAWRSEHSQHAQLAVSGSPMCLLMLNSSIVRLLQDSVHCHECRMGDRSQERSTC